MISYTSRIYYFLKPFIPRKLQIFIRRRIVLWQRLKYTNIWPIDEKAKKPPKKWLGWPEGKRFALVLTHDVETQKGLAKCYDLIQLEKEYNFRSSFNFVAKRYKVTPEIRHYLINNGFEVGLHGLNHDMSLYKSEKTFMKQAVQINQYLRDWGCAGFRSPSMLHNLDWHHYLDIEYDASTFDTDPFEPQPDGMGTIFPFWVPRNLNPLTFNLDPLSSNPQSPHAPRLTPDANLFRDGYVELPYTLPQDHTLFIIMNKGDINIWKQKLDWIVKNGGMALLLTHPDYMNFGTKKLSIAEYPATFYEEFLSYIKNKYEGQYWHALPKEMARFWTKNFTE
jgi:peptidoglycan/xylan/chitin deacetylase (PgdA/CDA1 family)